MNTYKILSLLLISIAASCQVSPDEQLLQKSKNNIETIEVKTNEIEPEEQDQTPVVIENQPQPTLVKEEENTSFETIYNQILKPSCVTCHTEYKSHEVVALNANNILDSIETGRMPKSKTSLKKELVALFKKWVDEETPLNNKPFQKNAIQPNWTSLYAHVFAPKCQVCHNPEGSVSYLPLDTYEAFISRDDLVDLDDHESSYLLEIIEDPDEPMPPAYTKVTPLNSEQLDTLKQWIELGLPVK